MRGPGELLQPGPQKALRVWAKDWGFERKDIGVIPAIMPVAIVDEAVDLAWRYRPEYFGRGTMAATAAVYGLVGIQATTRPIVIHRVGPASMTTSAGGLYVLLGNTDLRTANLTESALVTGLPRGEARTGAILQGTTAVASWNGWVMWDATLEYVLAYGQGDAIYLRPGEYLWCKNTTPNDVTVATFRWRELLIDPPPPVGDQSG